MALAAAAESVRPLLADKPDSNFDGVQIGTITYSYRADPGANDAVQLLKMIVDSGISAIELMPPAAEAFAGSPAAAQGGGGFRGGFGGSGGGRVGAGRAGNPGVASTAGSSVACAGGEQAGPGPGRPGGGGGGRSAPTPEQIAAAEELKKWRLSVSMDKFKAFRRMYNDAGVTIYCHKLFPTANMSNEEYDYFFNVAAALGATQVSLELSPDEAYTKRLGDFALKHNMVAAYHYHTAATITSWDRVLAQSKGNAVNLDAGHYLAGTGLSPIPAIEKYQGRIASIHLKDRTTPAHCALNLPWGEGDTPIAEILRLISKNKWQFPASIELEYQIPEGSNSVLEVRKCVEFCKRALA